MILTEKNRRTLLNVIITTVDFSITSFSRSQRRTISSLVLNKYKNDQVSIKTIRTAKYILLEARYHVGTTEALKFNIIRKYHFSVVVCKT